MSKPKKPPLVRLSDLVPNQPAVFFALLAEKTHKTTRDGKAYYTCKFRDARRTLAAAPVWADGPLYEECHAHWQPGQHFKIRGAMIDHERYGAQLEVEQIRPVEERDRGDGFTELDLVERSRTDPEQAFAELEALVAAEVNDPPLRTLVSNILRANAAELKALPASARTYYPFAGGWLEHTLSVARNCVFLADRYAVQFPDLRPPLNRDLVVAGAVLHDIGRLKELDPAPPGAVPKLGVDGELFGHLLLGRDLLRDAARDVPDLHPELLKLLEHLVYTHLKTPEWGSPKLPAIPEVLLVHHADDLDAKFEMYARCLTRDTADGPFTDSDPVLKRALYKGRQV